MTCRLYNCGWNGKPEEIESLFDSTTNRYQGGFCIGGPICCDVASAWEWEIFVESKESVARTDVD